MGLQVNSHQEQMALAALNLVGWNEETVAREAVRAVVVKSPVDAPLFEAAWQQFWLLLRRPGSSFVAGLTLMSSVMKMKSDRHRHPDVLWMGQQQSKPQAPEKIQQDDPFSVFLKGASTSDEVLRYKEFSTLTEAELDELLRFVRVVEPVRKRSVRRKAVLHGRTLDLARTLRRNAGSPEIIALTYQTRRTEPRPVVLLCDVSGSMDPYSRVLLRFAHALCLHDWNMEVFVFSTRLTRVTKWLEIRDSNDALSALTSHVPHLSGGTRLSDALSSFHYDYAQTVLRPGSIVLLATDGMDTGEQKVLERGLARLARRSGQLIWLNPLCAHPGYTPTARGAQVLNSYADLILPAHNFAALEEAWRKIGQSRDSRPERRQW